MTDLENLQIQVSKLPDSDKWQLVKYVLGLLESQQTSSDKPEDYHEFLRQTYGSLRDTPIQRYDQGSYEEREPLE